MAVTVTQLAVALRIVGSETETVPAATSGILTRQLAVANALITLHAPDAPTDVKDEAAIRIVGFLFDKDPARARNDDPMTKSGAGSILAPWNVQTLAIPLDAVNAAAASGFTGADLVRLLTALQGTARLPASAIRDLPEGGGGTGLTSDQRETLEDAVQVDGISFSGTDLTFTSDGGDSHSVNFDQRLIPSIESGDAGKVLKVDAGGTTADWRDDDTADSGSGLDQAAVDARVNALVPATRRVPVVGSGDVGRILTAPQSAGGQPTWNSNPGQTQPQVDARVNTLVPAAARVPTIESGDANKVLKVNAAGTSADWETDDTASSGSGLDQAAVDARIAQAARVGDLSRWPESKLPQKLDDLADSLYGTSGFQDEGSDPTKDAWVATTFSTLSFPHNVSTSFTFAQSVTVSPRQTNVYAVIRAPSAINMDLLRLAYGSFATYDSLSNIGLYTIDGVDYDFYTVLLTDAPAGDRMRVQRFVRFQFDQRRVDLGIPAVIDRNVSSWALVDNTGVIPESKIPARRESRFFTELLDGVRGIPITQYNRSIQQSLTAFSTGLTLASSDHGVLLVSIQASPVGTGRLYIGDVADASKLVYLSELRASDAYDGSGSTKGNGVLILSVSVHTFMGSTSQRLSTQGVVKCYIARNAANQVGTYAVYEPASGASGSTAYTVALNWEVSLLRTDPGVSDAGGLGSPTLSGTFTSAGSSAVTGITLPATGKYLFVGSCNAGSFSGYADMAKIDTSTGTGNPVFFLPRGNPLSITAVRMYRQANPPNARSGELWFSDNYTAGGTAADFGNGSIDFYPL